MTFDDMIESDYDGTESPGSREVVRTTLRTWSKGPRGKEVSKLINRLGQEASVDAYIRAWTDRHEEETEEENDV